MRASITTFFFQQQVDDERALLGRAGLGRQTVNSSAILNPLPDIRGVPVGTPLNFPGAPAQFTGAKFLSILPDIRAGLIRNYANSDPAVISIQVSKQAATGLHPGDVPSWSAQHVNVGVQRELARNFVATADFVYRHFIHGGLGAGGIDLNHFNSTRGPVIPQCSGAQRNDPAALCSTGAINVWQSTSTQTYKGLLLRADKRLSDRLQVLASYAYSSNTGTPQGAGFNLDNWHENPGRLATDFTHIANVAGVLQMPWRFELGFNFSYASAPPFNATVSGIDFNGDGTTGDLLPGTTVGEFNRGLGSADLIRLVGHFNQTYAGANDTHGRPIPRLTLPSRFSLDHGFQSLDLRVSRHFVLRERWRLVAHWRSLQCI